MALETYYLREKHKANSQFSSEVHAFLVCGNSPPFPITTWTVPWPGGTSVPLYEIGTVRSY